MPDMPDMGKKVGPLPMGAWIAVVAGGLALGYYINKKNSANQQPTAEQLTESGVGTGGGTFLPISPPSDNPVESEPDTNQSWTQKAINWLIAQNMDSIVGASAVNKYINGQSLTAQESAMVAMVLAHFGAPPEGVSAPPDTGVPATPGNLQLLGTVGGSVMLSWSPVSGATGYEIRWTSQWGEGGPELTVLPTWTSLGHDSRYDHTFYVRAVNDFGASQPASVNVPKWSGNSAPSAPNQPPPSSTPPPSSGGRVYSILKGDTLTLISLKHYGTPSRWQAIYNNNAGAIEDAARRNGKQSSRGGPNNQVGWWIYPGTVLNIP
jgi:hypothetical protein